MERINEKRVVLSLPFQWHEIDATFSEQLGRRE
jgi:hypothetical protein